MATMLTNNYQKISEAYIGTISYGSGSSSLYLRQYAKLNSQNVNNNTSTYETENRVYCDGYYVYTSNCSSSIASQSIVSGASYTFPSYSELTIGSKTFTITHNNDGTKTGVSVASAFSGYGLSGGTATGTFDLPTIPRASTATCTTANIGENAIIVINRKSNSFTHTLSYSFPSDNGNATTKTGDIVSKTTETTISFPIPTNFYENLINSTRGKGTLTLKTYKGNTQIGSNYTFNFYVTVSDDNKPNVTITALDTQKTLPINDQQTTYTLTGSRNKIIKGFSDVEVTITASGKQHANIVANSYVATCGDGRSGNANPVTFANVESNLFTGSATDTRGLTNSDSKTLTMIEYVDIKTTRFELKRESQVSSKIQFRIEGAYFNGNFGNTTNDISLRYRYRQTGGTWSTYTNLSLTKNNGNFSYTNNSLRTDCNYQKAYEFEFELKDKIHIYTIPSNNITKGVDVMSWGEDDVNVNGELNVNKKTVELLVPVGTILQYAGSTAPTNFLKCEGQAISRTDYADLYSIIGTTYGAGDGSTTFNLPNLKGKVPVGVNSSETEFATLGKTGGEKTHKLTIGEMPSHNHLVSNYINWYAGGENRDIVGPPIEENGIYSSSTGGGQPHNNLQPYIVLNYIIKAKKTLI